MRDYLKQFKSLDLYTDKELKELVEWADEEIFEWKTFATRIKVERVKRLNKDKPDNK